MKVISEKDSPDPETLVYGMTVINKTLRGIPDSVSHSHLVPGAAAISLWSCLFLCSHHQFFAFIGLRPHIQDTYYDAVDTLEMLGMEDAMKSMTKLANNELLEQCRLYERELSKEDERAENSDEDANARLRWVPDRLGRVFRFRFPSLSCRPISLSQPCTATSAVSSSFSLHPELSEKSLQPSVKHLVGRDVTRSQLI